MKTGPKPRTLQEAWDYMIQNSVKDGDCILYQKSRPVGIGYRFIRAGGLSWYAHHLAFFLAGKKLQSGQIRRHTCDKASCINADHIIAGTHQDNIRDKIERGRGPMGETHYRSRLTIEDVREIRQSELNYTQLGEKYNISRGAIHNIKSGRSWRNSQ